MFLHIDICVNSCIGTETMRESTVWYWLMGRINSSKHESRITKWNDEMKTVCIILGYTMALRENMEAARMQ